MGFQLPAGVDDLEVLLDTDGERLLAHRNLPGANGCQEQATKRPGNEG